jgi:hypothetical protein
MIEKKGLRFVVAASLSAALLVPLAFFGGTGFAKNPSAAQYQYRITICHHTRSTNNPTVTITVSNRAWPAHQKHHDTMGACPPPATPAAPAPTPAAPSTTTGPGKSGDHGNGNGKAHGHGK